MSIYLASDSIYVVFCPNKRRGRSCVADCFFFASPKCGVYSETFYKRHIRKAAGAAAPD
jgi:hypothetical protein